MSGEPTLRPAVPADHPAFAALFPELAVDDPTPDSEKFARELVGTTIFAERDQEIVGYAYFRPLGAMTHLAHLVVAKGVRRTGIGRKLLREVAERAKALGSRELSMNVLPTNTAAIQLYESFGLAKVYESRSVRIPWSLVEGLAPEETPFASAVRDFDAGEDARVEKDLGLTAGRVSVGRPFECRVFRMIEREGRAVAGAVLDTSFPGASPFCAPDLEHALSLLRVLRPFARATDDSVSVMLEDRPDVAAALVARGGTLRMTVLFMRGALSLDRDGRDRHPHHSTNATGVPDGTISR